MQRRADIAPMEFWARIIIQHILYAVGYFYGCLAVHRGDHFILRHWSKPNCRARCSRGAFKFICQGYEHSFVLLPLDLRKHIAFLRMHPTCAGHCVRLYISPHFHLLLKSCPGFSTKSAVYQRYCCIFEFA